MPLSGTDCGFRHNHVTYLHHPLSKKHLNTGRTEGAVGLCSHCRPITSTSVPSPSLVAMPSLSQYLQKAQPIDSLRARLSSAALRGAALHSRGCVQGIRLPDRWNPPPPPPAAAGRRFGGGQWARRRRSGSGAPPRSPAAVAADVGVPSAAEGGPAAT